MRFRVPLSTRTFEAAAIEPRILKPAHPRVKGLLHVALRVP